MVWANVSLGGSKVKRNFFPSTHSWDVDLDKPLSKTASSDISFPFPYFSNLLSWTFTDFYHPPILWPYPDSKFSSGLDHLSILWSTRPCHDLICFSSCTWHSTLYAIGSQKSFITLKLKLDNMQWHTHKTAQNACRMVGHNSESKEPFGNYVSFWM